MTIHELLQRVAVALERIAAALEPGPERFVASASWEVGEPSSEPEEKT